MILIRYEPGALRLLHAKRALVVRRPRARFGFFGRRVEGFVRWSRVLRASWLLGLDPLSARRLDEALRFLPPAEV